MHHFRSLDLSTLERVISRVSTRLKSTIGRPSAPLGSRILNNPDDIFKHNMWDHVEWTEADKHNAQLKAAENSKVHMPLGEQGKFDTEAHHYWDKFYELHEGKFFKDRKWLLLEFPELLPSDSKSQERGFEGEMESEHQQCHSRTHFDCTSDHQKNEEAMGLTYPGQHASFRILEVGCGVGNSVFPILNHVKENSAFLYCCDFSPCAIQLLKSHPDYDHSVCHAFVHDICKDEGSLPFPPQSLDVILAVFVLSSIHPDRMQGVVNRLSSYLKFGGIFLFRDYGRYDLSQLRFKKGRCLSDNFYARGDGTCVYFFTKDEVNALFTNAGLEEVQNLEDRRIQVNRGKKVSMHRVWMQSKYRKLHPSSPC
ncbi:mRNA N(3)-methylcytidine methyltransferase METTL8 isoform X1 [Syngnathus typhle]|uniref:mRNA N(3)-methylcytidine methyltransferase METTL8 isoform X1 n=1 Tax=Syngnathus typhle TaxID=161592 RepID=UPI002A6AA2FD|nr:mRNA N(3)-methylcytidine methyltransferase METTL8 isoform X1 [Syngnathus typhle]XP_061142914.1 mRNA N(3)-methylcytidine methyltransferase METTL8 isoform X1 [Syngnathus typhle]XP_061142915.1 mRNA N(3)-methylcytidine methyltransferase METTL8 isoform X1 [Syngnathus typhle]XP_061142916.1 mRNA N(3)-methylcytidine methyltransferase METTL8 isoform X1 [Syngnathus typhle]XP_061142917.1 mRNA N(3)-methylcytidine methyltransferase METTL8 isoform X1 [Syngnathus typhle]